MDKFLDDFFEKQDDEFVEEFEFMSEYENFSDKLYCICEGVEDKLSYLPKIKNILRRDVEIFEVRGKSNVIEVFNRCEEQEGYNLNRIMFIVDRDFDEPLNHEKIYELPVYSVENLYAMPEVLKDFVSLTIEVTNAKIIKDIINNYLEREKEYTKSIQKLNICLYLTKKIFEQLELENEQFSQYKGITLPSIDDNEVKKQIIISLKEIKIKDGLNEIMERYSFLNPEDIEKMKSDRFSIGNSRENYKGKYHIYFFLSYLKELVKDMNLGKSKSSERILADKNYGCDIELKDKTLINILSNYIQIPICLEDYIKKFAISGEVVSAS